MVPPIGVPPTAAATTNVEPAAQVLRSAYVLALDDKQFIGITVSSDVAWATKPDEDISIVRVHTQPTPVDNLVSLGGKSISTVRTGVYP